MAKRGQISPGASSILFTVYIYNVMRILQPQTGGGQNIYFFISFSFSSSFFFMPICVFFHVNVCFCLHHHFFYTPTGAFSCVIAFIVCVP